MLTLRVAALQLLEGSLYVVAEGTHARVCRGESGGSGSGGRHRGGGGCAAAARGQRGRG